MFSPTARLSSLLAAMILPLAACAFDLGFPTEGTLGGGGGWAYIPPTAPAEAFFGCSVSASYVIGTSVTGELSDSDCAFANERRLDRYDFTLAADATVTIDLRAAFDTYLYLFDAAGTVIDQNDDIDGELNSRIRMSLAAGSYSIGVSSFSGGTTGEYVLSSR